MLRLSEMFRRRLNMKQHKDQGATAPAASEDGAEDHTAATAGIGRQLVEPGAYKPSPYSVRSSHRHIGGAAPDQKRRQLRFGGLQPTGRIRILRGSETRA